MLFSSGSCNRPPRNISLIPESHVTQYSTKFGAIFFIKIKKGEKRKTRNKTIQDSRLKEYNFSRKTSVKLVENLLEGHDSAVVEMRNKVEDIREIMVSRNLQLKAYILHLKA